VGDIFGQISTAQKRINQLAVRADSDRQFFYCHYS